MSPKYPGSRTTSLVMGGIRYQIHDAYPTKAMAQRTARDARKVGLWPPKKYRTLVRVVDLGPDAGRLRYAIFVARRKK